MSEILSLQIGKCGIEVGEKFWQMLLEEHGISTTGKFEGELVQNEKIGVYFKETPNKKYVPRALVFDLDPQMTDKFKNGSLGELFGNQTIRDTINNGYGAGNSWAKGCYLEGAEVVDIVLDSVRTEVEACDRLQGFQLTHSLGGGTGSGFGSLLLDKLKEEYPGRVTNTFSIIPSGKVSDVVVEPYNTVLTLPRLIEYADSTFYFDNAALYDISTRILQHNKPTYDDLNDILTVTMSGITAPFRFPEQLNSDLRKLSINLVPFPRMHFLGSGFSPLIDKIRRPHRLMTVTELTEEIFDSQNFLINCDLKHGRHLGASAIFRGNASQEEMDNELGRMTNKESPKFVEWIPDNMKTMTCHTPQPGFKITATSICNTTAITESLQTIHDNFNKLWKRKAFLHGFCGEGLDEMEFTEAQEELLELIREYTAEDGII